MDSEVKKRGMDPAAYFWLASVLTTYGDKLGPASMATIAERITQPSAAQPDAGDITGDALQRAAGELPEGWEIVVSVEKGAGSVELRDYKGIEKTDFPIDYESSIADAINAATDAALAGPQS